MTAGDYRIVAPRSGGPEVMVAEPMALGPPRAGEVLVRHEAVGVNFVDTYFRSGLYPANPPIALGAEAAGVVEAVGAGVPGFAPGDRVAYATAGQGCYATRRLVEHEHLVPLPPSISFDDAAASLLKGMTAAFLIGPCARIAPGQSVLVHAAAGGVGSILVPWLRSIGAVVIAHVGSPGKAERVLAAGAHHCLTCPMDLLAEEVRRLTGGSGVDVVLDGVGAASWAASIGAAATRGLLVSYGNASGAVPPVAPLELSRAGSLFLTRPTLWDYARKVDERRELAQALFAAIAEGTIRVETGQRFSLCHAAAAHRALEERRTVGSTLLTVDLE